MSDEAAKRRELRKQRILGNSENRLKRILDKEDKVESKISNPVIDESPNLLPFPRDHDEADSFAPNNVTGVSSHSRTPLVMDHANDLDPPIGFPDFASMGFLNADQHGDLLSSQPVLDMADLGNLSDANNPMELLCRIAASLDEAKSESTRPQSTYRGPTFLINSANTLRIRFIFLLGVVSRFLLPTLPAELAKVFGPLYLLEVFLFSLCILYKAPFKHSSMSMLYSLLSLFGIQSKLLTVAQFFFSCLELLLRDMWTYSFSFFVTHALCQQLEIFET